VVIGIVLGFLLGIIASGIATIVYERATRPLLNTVVDESGRVRGRLTDKLDL
jgi:hypothetical protein